ncbi:MAG: hypothetical protein JO209_04105 [Acidisphaera sp.]|nr:hypothetical protein [Acidisphaera sp.]
MKSTCLAALAALALLAGCNQQQPQPQAGTYNSSGSMGEQPRGVGVNQPAVGTPNVGSMQEQPRTGGATQTPMSTPNQGTMHAP